MFKYLVVFGALFSFSFVGLSQVTTNSPYSVSGLGLWEEPQDGISLGRGGSRIAFNDSLYANEYNPATLSFLAKGQPIFSFDIAGRLSNFESSVEKSSARFFYLKSIQITIPFAHRFAVAAGIKPIVSRGYDFKTYQEIEGDSIRHSYIGSGGVQQVYLAFSSAIIKNDKTYLSLGLEGGYNFGNTTNSRVTEFTTSSSYFNSVYHINDKVNTLNLRAGLSYQREINKRSSIAFGAVYQPQNNWTTKNSESLIRFTGEYGVSTANQDTIFTTGIQTGTVTMPQRIGFGVNYEFRARMDSLATNTNLFRLRFMGDIEHMAWSNYKKDVPGLTDSTSLSDALFVRLGLEYTPHYKFNDKAPNISYFSKMTYRAGFNYAQLPSINQDIKDFGITFGLGFPIPFNRSLSSLNIGVKLGQQGEVGPQSIKEQYVGIHFGIILSPGFNDRWFRKFKYD